ncbi:MAG: hypothetical protein RLZZ78_1708 [Armatimonadota bacterium]
MHLQDGSAVTGDLHRYFQNKKNPGVEPGFRHLPQSIRKKLSVFPWTTTSAPAIMAIIWS